MKKILALILMLIAFGVYKYLYCSERFNKLSNSDNPYRETIENGSKSLEVQFELPVNVPLNIISIDSMLTIKGRFVTIYYSQEAHREAIQCLEILNKGDSIITKVTGLSPPNFNLVICNEKGFIWSNLQTSITISIAEDPLLFKEKLFSIFHEQVESELVFSSLDLYFDKNNRFIGDGIANYVMWNCYEKYSPDHFYRLSQIIQDKFCDNEAKFDLRKWAAKEYSEKEDSVFVFMPEYDQMCYYIAPYFWAKIIKKSGKLNLIKEFIEEFSKLSKQEKRQETAIRILDKLTGLDINEELIVSAEELRENISKYWLFFKIPNDMVVVYGPPSDSVRLSENSERKFIVDYYYLIDKYEVTNEQFCQFLNEVGNQKEGNSYWIELDMYPEIQKINDIFVVKGGYEEYPVRCVTWFGAKAYSNWSKKRLPTEIEWKKAAQGRNWQYKYPWQRMVRNNYDAWEPTYCNWKEEGKIDGYEYSAPVNAFKEGKSLYGCFNLVGNVFEWVEDYSVPLDYLPTINPCGDEGSYKIHVGGCFKYEKSWQNTYSRILGFPSNAYTCVGFRCAKDLPTIEELQIIHNQ